MRTWRHDDLKAHTQASLLAKARSLGLTYHYKTATAEHVLNVAGGTDDTAYYTDSATDAWQTLDALAAQSGIERQYYTKGPAVPVREPRSYLHGYCDRSLDRHAHLSERQRQLQEWEDSLW